MKAVVLETRDREAAILRTDGVVCRVRGSYEVGQEIDYIEAAHPSFVQWVAAVLVAAILLGGSAGLWIGNNYVACAEVSLDVNPSIVYTLNRRNRVLSVEAVNDDAAEIVEALRSEHMRFMPIGDAVEKTMDVLTDRGYLDGDGYVLAGVSADDEARRNDLAETVEAAFTRTAEREPAMAYRIERTDRAAAREARAHGMSPGRYAAWKEREDDPDPGEYADMPVRQIIDHMEAPADAHATAANTATSAPPAARDEAQPDAAPKADTPAAPEPDAPPATEPDTPAASEPDAPAAPSEPAPSEHGAPDADASNRREGGQDERSAGDRPSDSDREKPSSNGEGGRRGDKKPSSDGRGSGADKSSPGHRSPKR